jgi:hypothetical protein
MDVHDSLVQLGFRSHEARELIVATERHCTCSLDALVGEVVSQCPSHRRLSNQDDLKHMLFARRLVVRWRAGEFEPPIVPAGKLVARTRDPIAPDRA